MPYLYSNNFKIIFNEASILFYFHIFFRVYNFYFKRYFFDRWLKSKHAEVLKLFYQSKQFFHIIITRQYVGRRQDSFLTFELNQKF